ncbi:hypothetical protein CRG98_043021 [Punica granatum]|uniref:Uncharacterized protein n=1 Tax=Punica granatum TaxID=22663 RepID=A0A2I0HY28_PUNGR|nr:hypothetical protein CRG98_043021 [Punica granatum]
MTSMMAMIVGGWVSNPSTGTPEYSRIHQEYGADAFSQVVWPAEGAGSGEGGGKGGSDVSGEGSVKTRAQPTCQTIDYLISDSWINLSIYPQSIDIAKFPAWQHQKLAPEVLPSRLSSRSEACTNRMEIFSSVASIEIFRYNYY